MNTHKVTDIWARKLLFLALIISFSLALAPLAFAHGGITIDGSASDWCGTPPGSNNTGATSCGTCGCEWIWKDASGDQRNDGDDPDSNYDLTEFRVTGDSTYLYFLLKFSDITDAGRPYVGIAIDTNRTAGSGQQWFGDNADTQVHNDAYWEREVVVNLNKTGYYNTAWTWTDAGNSQISASNDVVEIRMPLSGLGITWSTTLRFTVLIGQNDNGGIKEVGYSDALDVISTASTWGELSTTDDTIDYYSDVQFGPTAVTLSSFTATSALPRAGAVLAIGGVGALAGVLWLRRRTNR